MCLCLLGFVSCGPKKPTAAQVDQYMENLSLRLNMSKDAYMRFINTLPKEQNSIGASASQTVLELSIKNLKEERQLLDHIEPFKADEDTKTKSESLKQAAAAIIDTYIDGAGKELSAVCSALKQGNIASSPEVEKLLGDFEQRLHQPYEAYGNIQEELARAYGISLY